MFDEIYKNKKVLVTGNTGFKGSWLSCWLTELGADVYGYSDQIPTSPSMYNELGLESKVKQFWGDVRDLEKIKKVVNEVRPNFIFHLAAQAIVSTSYKDPINTITANVLGSVHIAQACRELDLDTNLIMITSDKCYFNSEWVWGYKETDRLGGKDIYSGSKAAAEVLLESYFYSFLQKSSTKMITVRAGNVIGGGDWAKDRIVPDCFRSWSKGDKVTIRSPNSTRPWQHVLEPLSGYLSAGEFLAKDSKYSGESYNFGPDAGTNIPVSKLIQRLFSIWGETKNDGYIVEGNIPFHEAKLLKLNCDKALFDFQWRPVLRLNETVEFVGEWYKEFYKNGTKDLLELTLAQIGRYQRLAQERQISWSK